MEWSASDVFKVISLYRQYPCLWEYGNPEYRRADLKKIAWEEIAKEMGKSMEEVKKKIKYLRSTYVGQKKKAEESKSTGSASDEVYKPHLCYYNEFEFLDSVVVLRQTPGSLRKTSYLKFENNPENDVEDNAECSTEDSRFSPMPISNTVEDKRWREIKRAKIDRNKKFNYALDAIITKLENNSAEETMFTAYGKCISMQLAKLPVGVATNKMVDIQKILADAIKEGNKRSNMLELIVPDPHAD